MTSFTIGLKIEGPHVVGQREYPCYEGGGMLGFA